MLLYEIDEFEDPPRLTNPNLCFSDIIFPSIDEFDIWSIAAGDEFEYRCSAWRSL